MAIPPAYQGREQTYLKHCVLREYLLRWGHKLGSTSQYGPKRLWYVDCFAGPWEAKDEQRQDTSVSIALNVLNEVQSVWSEKGLALSTHAIFVEANPKSYPELREHVGKSQERVEAHTLPGTFGDSIANMRRLLGDDAAFVFVDPTGWKGVGMQHIARLVDRPRRDVMINVMYHHINRFKSEEKRAWLREQICDFFGTADNEELRELDEAGLLGIYRRNLKQAGRLKHTLELGIPHPTKDQTFFNLVVGGNHSDVVSLFRDIEQRIVGEQASAVREEAKRTKNEQRTGQGELLFGDRTGTDQRYERVHTDGLVSAREAILKSLESGPQQYGGLWPRVLEEAHVTKAELNKLVANLRTTKEVAIASWKTGQRTPHDDDVLTRPADYTLGDPGAKAGPTGAKERT